MSHFSSASDRYFSTYKMKGRAKLCKIYSVPGKSKLKTAEKKEKI